MAYGPERAGLDGWRGRVARWVMDDDDDLNEGRLPVRVWILGFADGEDGSK